MTHAFTMLEIQTELPVLMGFMPVGLEPKRDDVSKPKWLRFTFWRGNEHLVPRLIAFCQRLGLDYDVLRGSITSVNLYIPRAGVTVEFASEDVDWRPQETLPEDFYAA